ncbi:MAG: NYN domain-containing protein [Thermodesulfobacteriota bacterium]
MPEPYSDETNIALFIDMENLVRAALDIALPVDFAPVISRLLQMGRLTMRRAFGDLDAACRNDRMLRAGLRRMLYENLIGFEDIPYVTRYKNTADMRLVVEALATAYTYPYISHFALVASDRDYLPLINKLRELGKRIIGIGASPDTVNPIYVKSCDIFIHYSSLFPPPPEIVRPEAPASATDEVLLADETVLGLASETDQATKNGPTEGAPDPSDLAACVGRYRQYFRAKLKCDLPGPSLRQKIYETAGGLLAELQDEAGIELAQLSELTATRINTPSAIIAQSSVFKVLYSLYRARVFRTLFGLLPYNPRIREASLPPAGWDTLFIRNCLVVLRGENPDWPLLPGPLAEVFQTDEDLIARIVQDMDD